MLYNQYTKSGAPAATDDMPVRSATQWYNSPGHRSNMLAGKFTSVGFGWVQTSCPKFASKDVVIWTGVYFA